MKKNKFDYEPYLKKPLLLAFEDLLLDLQEYINKELKDYPNFLGVQFIDVSAGGIQIRGFHKDVVGYSYGRQTTIKYDMSNAYEAADEFIVSWKANDNNESLSSTLRFIKTCEEYGWD